MLAALAALAIGATGKGATLMAVGDILLDRYVGRAISRHGASYPLERVRSTLETADQVYANLECPLTSQPRELQKRFLFRAVPDSARALKLKVPLVVSVANNHTLDCGRPGLSETISILKSAGISLCGGGETSADAWSPRIVDVKGIRLAFIGYTDFEQRVSGTMPTVAYFEAAALEWAVKRARGIADIVIVCPHWGIEGTTKLWHRQVEQAELMSRLGVDLVLGSHPHVVQPIQWIGRTCVLFSMGDFVFDTQKPEEQRSAIFVINLTRGGVRAVDKIPVEIRNNRPELRKR